MAGLGSFPSPRPVPPLSDSSKGSGKQIGLCGVLVTWSWKQQQRQQDSLGTHTALGGNHADSSQVVSVKGHPLHNSGLQGPAHQSSLALPL